MSIQRFALLGTVLVLAGCSATEAPSGSFSAPPSPVVVSTAPSSAAPSATPSISPSEYPGIDAQGIVVVSCQTRDGAQYIDVAQYVSAGLRQKTVTFKWPSNDVDPHSNAECASTNKRPGFNQDFTRLFMSRKDTVTGAVGIAYLNPEPEGDFRLLSSSAADAFTAVKDEFPSYRTADGRVYYCNNADSPSKLMSMTIDGLDVKEEKLSRDECTEVDTNLPAKTADGSDVIYDRKGTTSVSVSETSKAPSLILTRDGRKTIHGLPVTNFGYHDLVLVGLLESGDVVFTDAQKIYRATLSGTTVQVTTLLDNTVKDNEIVDTIVSADGTRVAFITENGSIRKLYSLMADTCKRDGTTETCPRTEFADLGPKSQIVQFN